MELGVTNAKTHTQMVASPLFFHIVDTTFVNSYIMHKTYARKGEYVTKPKALIVIF